MVLFGNYTLSNVSDNSIGQTLFFTFRKMLAIHKPRQVWFKAEQRKREVVRAYTPGDYIAFLKNVADTLIL
uniref:Uncharacterized protein n=1 Tax=Acrobeloides nanus TaxID=290746 RepID=A0A914CN65_9BILA